MDRPPQHCTPWWVLQVYQAKLHHHVGNSGPEPALFKELCSATDLALRATKATAEAIGPAISCQVVPTYGSSSLSQRTLTGRPFLSPPFPHQAYSECDYQINPHAISPWVLIYIGGSERWLISQIAPHHRPFLRFAFKGVA